MTVQLGSVGVGLSVAFALFMLVLSVELYYVWTCRRKRRVAETWNCSRSRAVKQEVRWSFKWRHMVAARWRGVGAQEVKRWAVKLCHLSSAQAATVVVVEEGQGLEAAAAAQGRTLEDGKKQEQSNEEEEGEEEEDVFKVGGILGPPRLLFTIKEETKEELELEEARSAGRPGKGSQRASGDVLFDTSACSSPFVTPPSSPPFATPFGSPAAPHLPLPLVCCQTVQDMMLPTQDMESSSSSSSSSSPPPGRHHLSALFEESSSFSSSSSLETPAAVSPLLPTLSTTSPIKRQRHPLSLLLDPPPSPSSALYHYNNRVHPLIPLPSPSSYHLHMHAIPLSKPVERHATLSSSFHLPAPSQPTTPCPFRATRNAKSMGLLTSATSATPFHLTVV